MVAVIVNSASLFVSMACRTTICLADFEVLGAQIVQFGTHAPPCGSLTS
jgi:hypothetical protein